LEGILDELRSDRLVDGIALDDTPSSLITPSSTTANDGVIPGAKHSLLKAGGARTTRPEVVTSGIKFSPTGRDWAVASTQGLQVDR